MRAIEPQWVLVLVLPRVRTSHDGRQPFAMFLLACKEWFAWLPIRRGNGITGLAISTTSVAYSLHKLPFVMQSKSAIEQYSYPVFLVCVISCFIPFLQYVRHPPQPTYIRMYQVATAWYDPSHMCMCLGLFLGTLWGVGLKRSQKDTDQFGGFSCFGEHPYAYYQIIILPTQVPLNKSSEPT